MWSRAVGGMGVLRVVGKLSTDTSRPEDSPQAVAKSYLAPLASMEPQLDGLFTLEVGSQAILDSAVARSTG